MQYQVTDFLKPHTIAARGQEWLGRFIRIVERDGPVCHLCNLSILLVDNLDYEQLVQDHIKPNTQGGPDGFENRGLAHASCDSLRGCHNVIIARAYISAWKNGTITRAEAKSGLHHFEPPKVAPHGGTPKRIRQQPGKQPVKQAAPPPLNKELIKDISFGPIQALHIHIQTCCHKHTSCDKI